MDLKEDGSFRLNLEYFGYTYKDRMTSGRMARLFGGPPRPMEGELTQREMDLAASIQKVTEEIMLRTCAYARTITGARHLTMAGGVALNCVANGRILREGPFDDVWIQPAAGDAGGALGAAMFVWHQLLENPRHPSAQDAQRGSLLGPAFGNRRIRAFLDDVGAVYHHFDREEDLLDEIADSIANQKVVGHMQGRMEFGPRALGNRSIVGDARSPNMQQVMNLKIKYRESFRPFAPSVLRDHAHEYFETPKGAARPYMLIVAPVCEHQRHEVEAGITGLDRLGQVRSTVPAVTHVNNSARVQTVDERNGRYHRLLERFYEKTGCPTIINTSFNVRGEPIVCSPEDAYRCFMVTEMDVLVMEDVLIRKEEQRSMSRDEIDEHLAKFELD
jgi:carbamoyltransferase